MTCKVNFKTIFKFAATAVFISIQVEILFSQTSPPLSVQQYLDSILNAPQDDTWQDMALYDTVALENGHTTFKAEISYDCYGDICYMTKMGIITKNKATLYPVFDDVLLLGSKNMMLIGSKYDMIVNDNLKVQEVFDFADYHEPGYYRIEKAGKWGILNRQGKMVLSIEYDYIEKADEHGRFAVEKEGKWQILKRDGLLPELKEEGYEFERMIELIAVWKDGHFGLLNEDGKLVTPFEYEDVQTFEGGYAGVSKEYLWALVNYEGEVITPFKYTELVKNYTWEYTLAKVSGRYGIIDHEGKELTDFNFQNIGKFFIYHNEIGLYNFVVINRKSGIINREGELIVPAIYDKFKGRYPDLYGKKNDAWIKINLEPQD